MERRRQKREEETTPLPVSCSFDRRRRLFRVTRSSGKTLASGGFGVFLPSSPSSADGAAADDDDDERKTEQQEKNEEDGLERPDDESKRKRRRESPSAASPDLYLFLEEVLFLHERGLIEVCDDDEEEEDNADGGVGEPSKHRLDSSRLYGLLDECGVPLAAYLVYAHCRAQAYRVVRHTATRRSILKAMKELPVDQRNRKSGSMVSLKLQLRRDAAEAPPPAVCSAATSNLGGPVLCYDAYRPNSRFSRTDPGLPDFCVAAARYGATDVTFRDVQALLRQCEGTRLNVATVSDAGTVVMFGATDQGVPHSFGTES